MQVILFCDFPAHDQAIGVIETIHADPLHIVIIIVSLLHGVKQIFRIQSLFLQDHVPCRARVFRIQVELPAFHGGLDIGSAAAHTLGQLHIQIRVLLDEQIQHFTQDILFCHRLRGNMDRIL